MLREFRICYCFEHDPSSYWRETRIVLDDEDLHQDVGQIVKEALEEIRNRTGGPFPHPRIIILDCEALDTVKA